MQSVSLILIRIFANDFQLQLNTKYKYKLQTKGIPMDGNASPLIADLYLSWLEYQYLSKLVRNKDFNLLHKLKYNSRYIDDIITPNVENFLEIAKHIYPTEISLEQTDNDSLHDTFLDLDIKVFHKVDLFDFEVISFPFSVG